MPKRFTDPKDHRSGDFSLSFRLGAKLDQTELSEQAGSAVRSAKAILLRARNKLERPNKLKKEEMEAVRQYAKYYFGWEENKLEERWKSLFKKVKTLESAIGNQFLIKITDQIWTTDGISQTADGRVRQFGENSKKEGRFQRNAIIPYVATDYGRKGIASRQYGPAYMGNVHIKASLFAQTHSAAQVLIHEFCHKYLGFHDGPDGNWYFDTDGESPPEGAAGERALGETADAMAWFIVKIAGKMDNMDMIAVNPTFTMPPSSPGCCILS
ncbi:MAG TPA: hypothetical protein VHC00_02615 [Rhizobiaceae bacterium]|nr:hypothetical protein [Rhizobiaceae bacterium]